MKTKDLVLLAMFICEISLGITAMSIFRTIENREWASYIYTVSEAVRVIERGEASEGALIRVADSLLEASERMAK